MADTLLIIDDEESIRDSLAGQYHHLAYKEAKRSFARDYLLFRLQENKGSISRTAGQIGMERSHLHRKVKSLHIEIEKE